MESLYKISAKSIDGQLYALELSSKPHNLIETFNAHICDIGWEHHQYRIVEYIQITKEHVDDPIE